MIMNQDHLQQYVDAWAEVDPAATGYVHAHKIEHLLRAVEEPVGLKARNLRQSRAQAARKRRTRKSNAQLERA